MNKLHIEVLRDNINSLNLSAEWVRYSYEQAQKIGIKTSYSAGELEKLEVLSSRYARTTDILVNKVLRSIDTVEFEDIGTIIDIMNRAAKRGIVQSVEILHALKDLRNNIVHEYHVTELAGFFTDVVKHTPLLLEIIENLNNYCTRYLESEA